MIKLLILLIPILVSCTRSELILQDPYAAGKVVMSKSNVVVRITKNVDYDHFEGIIIDSPDTTQLCKWIGADKNEFYQCTNCKSKC